jgi:tetratricopeptide (TPR) repeat protein
LFYLKESQIVYNFLYIQFMSRYFIRIFSIASIVTVLVFLTARTFSNSNNQSNQINDQLLANPTTSPITASLDNVQSNKQQAANNIKESLTPSTQDTSQATQWRQQISILRQDLQKYRRGDTRQEISTLSAIAVSYNELGDSANAIAYLQQAKKKLNSANIPPEQKSGMEPELLVGFATVYADIGNYPQVLEISRKISALSKKNIGSLGGGGFKLGDVTPTPEPTQSPKPDIKQDAQTLYTIATMQQKRGKISQAIRTAEAALNMLKTSGDREGEREINKYIDSLRQQL